MYVECKFGKINPVVLEIQGAEISDIMILVNNSCVRCALATDT